jgi:hypothetical protein
MREFEGAVPEHLREWWTDDTWCLHSAPWWRRHWERTGLVNVAVADTLPEGWRFWLDWHRVIAPDNAVEIRALEADAGRNMGYVRAVARRSDGESAEQQIESVKTEYVKKPLLRNES